MTLPACAQMDEERRQLAAAKLEADRAAAAALAEMERKNREVLPPFIPSGVPNDCPCSQ